MSPDQLKNRLQSSYPEAQIEVIDLTGTHDHYQVMISSEKFTGLSRIQQQRQVMDCFAAELKTGEVHALTIKTSIPDPKSLKQS